MPSYQSFQPADRRVSHDLSLRWEFQYSCLPEPSILPPLPSLFGSPATRMRGSSWRVSFYFPNGVLHDATWHCENRFQPTGDNRDRRRNTRIPFVRERYRSSCGFDCRIGIQTGVCYSRLILGCGFRYRRLQRGCQRGSQRRRGIGRIGNNLDGHRFYIHRERHRQYRAGRWSSDLQFGWPGGCQ